MNFFQFILFNLCQTTPPAITTSNKDNNAVYGIISILIIVILAITIIALICVAIQQSRELKKVKKLTELSEEQQKLLSDFENLTDDEKETVVKLINGLNSKK